MVVEPVLHLGYQRKYWDEDEGWVWAAWWDRSQPKTIVKGFYPKVIQY